MSIADKEKTPLELLADQVAHSRFAIKAVRFSQLNPEQQLAVSMEQLIVAGKEKLALMEVVLMLSKECIEWRKTPEGQAWMEKQAAKRAAAEAAKAAA